MEKVLAEIIQCLRQGLEVSFYRDSTTHTNHIAVRHINEQGGHQITKVWSDELEELAYYPEAQIAHLINKGREELKEVLKPKL